MALAHSVPQGIGSHHAAKVGEFLSRPRHTTVRRVLGWMGLAGLTALWLQFSVVALRIYSLVSAYEADHGPALAQWEGRAPRPPEFEALRLKLEGIASHGDGSIALGYPISMLILFGFWTGFSRWALAHRPVAWRRTFVAAALVVLAQAILLYPEVDAYNWITN